MSTEENILDKVETTIKLWYQQEMPAGVIFHNFHYALYLHKAIDKLSSKTELKEAEIELLKLAAYFQYVGMAKDYNHYKQHSCTIARATLDGEGYPSTAQVCQLIEELNNDLPQSLLNKVYEDAHHYFLGKNSYDTKSQLLRIELERMTGQKLSEAEWHSYQVKLLLNYHYYTPWARKKLGKARLSRIAQLESKRAKAKEKTLKKKTGKNLGRGVDTLYRTSFRNHINLSTIADGKANMMISINAIVLSILLTLSGAGISFLQDFTTNGLLYFIPVLILAFSSLIALVFAVFSAKPKVTALTLRKKKPELVDDSNVNLLYFGNFLQIEKEEFINYLDQLKSDQNKLYKEMSKDLYNLGIVLKRKYQLLTISYSIFAAGLVLSVLAFTLIYLFA
jgi:hypothetical protein